MKDKVFMTWMTLVLLAAAASAQSYIVVSGNTLPANSQSNVMVDYDLSTYDESLEPGDTGTLTLVLKNTGTQTANDVELTIDGTKDIKLAKKFFVGTIRSTQPVTVSLTYKIAEDADTGIHILPIRLAYDGYKSDGSALNNIFANYDFPIKVYGNPKIALKDVSIENSKVGEVMEITAAIVNKKDDAYNAVATLSTQSGEMTILGSDKTYVGELKSKESTTLNYRVHVSDKLTSGAYVLPLKVDYEDKGHSTYSETFNIGAYISGTPDISFTEVITDPEEANPGDNDVEVKIKVENIGSQEVKDLSISLNPTYPFTGSKSYLQKKDLGIMNANQFSTVSFYVDIDEDAEDGAYDLPFDVTYKVGESKKTEKKDIQVVVKEKPDFEMESNEVVGSPGDDRELRLKVTNVGKDCESVTAWVLKKSDHPFDFDDKSQLIGDLDKGEYGEAVLDFQVEDDAKEKTYILPVEIRCSKDDKVYIQSETAQITVQLSEGTSSQKGLVIMLLAVAFLAFAALVLLLKRLLKGKTSSDSKKGKTKR